MQARGRFSADRDGGVFFAVFVGLVGLQLALALAVPAAWPLVWRLVLHAAVALLLLGCGLAWRRREHAARMQADARLKQQEAARRQLLDATSEGLCGVDLQGRCVFANRAALAMLGLTDEAALIGQPLAAQIQPGAPDDAPLARAGRGARGWRGGGEVLQRADGSLFAVDAQVHPLLRGGQPQGAIVGFTDITERLHLQAELRQGESRLAKLVEAVMDGVVCTDDRESIVLFNPAAERLFGVNAVDAVGTPLARFIPKDDHYEQHVATALSHGVGLHELQGRRADGTLFPIEATVSRLSMGQGVLTTLVLRDVTERYAVRLERQAREALELSHRAKTDFLSRISHELRTPLNAVLGFSQLLRMDTEEPLGQRQRAWVGHVEEAGNHLLALVNDVLDLSRAEAGHMSLALSTVAVGPVVEESLALVSRMAAAAGITMESLQPGEAGGRAATARVLADRVRLKQVLVNLLSNAIKYNRPQGTVMVDWDLRGKTCRLRIADTGPGMSAQALEHLFEPFNRLGAEASKVEGTGIGLVLSRRLIELMGGELRIDSRVGVGTVATVTLEGSDLEPDPLPEPTTPSRHSALDGMLKVLYAEDNEVNVELLRQVASFRPAVELSVASSGGAALDMARRDPPDLMLVDMHLGDMSGLELATALRADPVTAGIPLVALSADAQPEQIDRALALGFEDYLTKPVEFRRLLRVFDASLGG
ncbi:PAS domain S-box protein [Pelomonas sp. CA6]|uniref:hybrid sensor histidine kinase/response regulator n=1 Tax=Pelomonas sp. CA6 TaxID=2907999 RepID=UPI001F4BF0DF|nr:PAS domain S-box protein [Pelomonas sp. CA6]MCH7345236.1 PAS domain S-box protein [Pelomonas sp. CA6]